MRTIRTKSHIWLILILALQVFSIPVAQSAIRMDNLYTVELPVANQGHQERLRAMRQGMVEVLTRVSGSQALDKFGQLLDVLDRSPRYVLQYHYGQKSSVPEGTAAQGTELVIWLKYDGKSILKLLQQQQMPIWGETRPQTLVWLAVEDKGERFLQGNDKTSQIYTYLQDSATRRGVPILFPLLDLEDQEKVKIADVWGAFSEVLRKSSSRYSVENILAGRLFHNSSGEWEAHWTFINRTDEYRWTVKGVELQQVLSAGMDGVAEQLVTRYAFRTDVANDSRYLLNVANVSSIEEYARMEEYLSSISLISRIQLVRVEKDSLIYRLMLRGTLDNLKQFISLGTTLLPVEVTDKKTQDTNAGNTDLKPLVPPGQSVTATGVPQSETIYYKLNRESQ